MYNLPRDYTFVFENAVHYVDSFDPYYDEFAVFLDSEFKEGTELLIRVDCDFDNAIITISPYDFTALPIEKIPPQSHEL